MVDPDEEKSSCGPLHPSISAFNDLCRELCNVMSHLHLARLLSEEGIGLRYPDMDRETFDEIVQLQSGLQRLISRLKK
jgi:hypothetical protein